MGRHDPGDVMATGVPVIVVDEGGFPVTPVESGGPLMTVATNGIGAPITLTDNGAPCVVQGLFDPAAVALFDAWDDAGAPADGARQTLVNNTIVALKAAGIWDELDLLYFTAAHAAAAAHNNWKSPSTFTLTPTAAPAFVANRGYTGNGTTSYLGTGYIPSTNGVKWLQSDASVWSWSVTDVASTSPDAGAGVTYVGAVNPRSATNTIDAQLNRATTALTAAMASSVGMSGVARSAGPSEHIWKNGVSVAAGTAGPSGRPTGEFLLCGRTPSSFSTRQVAFAAAGSACAGKELAFYNAVRAYMTGVGVP